MADLPAVRLAGSGPVGLLRREPQVLPALRSFSVGGSPVEGQALVSADTRQNPLFDLISRILNIIIMSCTKPNKRLFSRFLNKAVSMALWTKVSLRGESLLSERSLPSTPNRLNKISLCPPCARTFLAGMCSLWLYSSCRSLSAVAGFYVASGEVE